MAPGASEADVVTNQPKIDPKTNKKIWNNELQSYEYEEAYDDFARTKALSKALRNAMKPHIPQKLIIEMINIAEEKGQTKSFNQSESADVCTCTAEERNPSDEPITDGEQKGQLQCRHCAKPISKGVSAFLLQKRKEAQS